ncbi:unnamed protein product, partial [Nesidiocoris tenuis]
MSFFNPEKVQPSTHPNNEAPTSRNDQVTRSFGSQDLIHRRSPNQLFKSKVASYCNRVMNGSIDSFDCDHPSQRSIRPNDSRDLQNRTRLQKKHRRHCSEIEDADRPIKHSSSSKRYEMKADHLS